MCAFKMPLSIKIVRMEIELSRRLFTPLMSMYMFSEDSSDALRKIKSESTKVTVCSGVSTSSYFRMFMLNIVVIEVQIGMCIKRKECFQVCQDPKPKGSCSQCRGMCRRLLPHNSD